MRDKIACPPTSSTSVVIFPYLLESFEDLGSSRNMHVQENDTSEVVWADECPDPTIP